MVLITGGSGSGKSAYAEACISNLAGNRQKYYLATMRLLDQETRRKAENHRKARSGKGFLTIERPWNVSEALQETAGNAVLLECMSNLAANEMFARQIPEPFETVAERIVKDVEALNRGLAVLVVVTNHVFEDGVQYEEATMAYIKALGIINRRLAAMADRVVEVAAGIPLILKE